MTLRTTTIVNYITTDVLFRAFVQMWHDNFAATGMVQTADTGQINIATVVRAAASTAAGYEIWRFNDALAATAPIYVKVEYGGGGSLSNPNMWLTVGTGSNGAGTLTYTGWPGATALFTRRVMNSGSTAISAQTGPVYFTYLPDQSWAFLAWPSTTLDATGTWFYSVERFRNADGSPSPDGVTVLAANVTSSNNSILSESRFYLSGVAQQTSGVAYWPLPYTPQGSAGTVVGTTMYPVPVFTGMAPRLAAPSQFVVALGQNDYGAGLTFTCEHYGAAHSWISAGPGNLSNGFAAMTPVQHHKTFAMRGD